MPEIAARLHEGRVANCTIITEMCRNLMLYTGWLGALAQNERPIGQQMILDFFVFFVYFIALISVCYILNKMDFARCEFVGF